MSKPQPPPALIPPAPPEKTPEHTKAERDAKQVQIAYAHVFGGMHGETVLKDLRQQFGWDGDIELPSAIPGLRSEEVWLREGYKQPIRHIMKKLRPAPDQPQDKPTTATN